MSQRQAGRLLWGEFAPVVTLAVIAGGACGLATPLLLAPALDLATLTGGHPLPHVLAPTVATATAMVAALLAATAATQSVVNRRRGLGRVLRVS